MYVFEAILLAVKEFIGVVLKNLYIYASICAYLQHTYEIPALGLIFEQIFGFLYLKLR